MKKIKYPRYNKSQDLRCKLSDEDIKEIRRLRKLKTSLIDIAYTFNVSYPTVRYWLLSTTERNELNYQRSLKHIDIRDSKTKYNINHRFLRRKYNIMPNEYREYKRSSYFNSKSYLK